MKFSPASGYLHACTKYFLMCYFLKSWQCFSAISVEPS